MNICGQNFPTIHFFFSQIASEAMFTDIFNSLCAQIVQVVQTIPQLQNMYALN